MGRILFLCTGNYYRSRYAEELFNYLAVAQDVHYRAESAALAIERGVNNVGPISPHTREALSRHGIVCSPNRWPQPCQSMSGFERVIALDESEHRPLIVERFPRETARITFWHVEDVELRHHDEALQEIERNVDELISELKRLPRSPVDE